MAPLSPRFFNTTGPCRLQDHYILPPGRRLPDLRRLIQERRYFVLHAARQTGKTTTMRALAEELRTEGTVALHVSLEASRQTPTLADVEPRWLRAIADAAEVDLPLGDQPPAPSSLEPEVGTRLGQLLRRWAMALHPRPLVLFLDEVDIIEGEAMVSFLAQLRAGFNHRPRAFPSSIVLVGMRDLKDYLVQAKGGLPPNPGSPFNIKQGVRAKGTVRSRALRGFESRGSATLALPMLESLTLRNFTEAEVAELYAQHMADTGQPFTEDAVERAFYWSQGQPFLVNALAYHLTRREPVPPPTPITAEDIDRAKEHLVLSRTTHLDNLMHRLHEPRVARILEPLLIGDPVPSDVRDDLDYVQDLGLVRPGPEGLEPANPLYREVLARALAYGHTLNIPEPWWPWRRADGSLDMPALVDAFLGWWRRHGELLIDGTNAGWKEAAAHLAFMGFLQRVVNGGGRIEGEFSSGRGRLDLYLEYGGQRHAIELKRVPPEKVSPETVRQEGIEQLSGYLDTLGLDEGWLLIFDQRPGLGWEQRLWREEVEVGGRRLHLRGG